MKQWSKRSTWLTLLAACSLTLLGACGTNNDSTDSSGSATTSSEIATTFTDAMGNEVTVPENPQRVIGSYLEDYLVALGVTPVAQWTVGNDSDQAYLQDKLAEVPRINYDLPFEDVLSFEPDLLLMDSNSMVEGDKYDQYSKIAPTYVVTNGEDVTWRERLTDIAKVLHKEEQAAQVEADYDELVAATKETYADQIQGKSIAVLWVVNNSVFMVSETKSSGQLLYHELGFEVPALVSEISESATADWSAVSLEKLAELDADYLILVNSDKGADFFSEQVWQNLNAVKNNHLWEFGPESSWLYNGPIAYTKMIEDIQSKLD
ncbi:MULTISPECIES: ABC transporter substrate-binding protein [Enterococcus]|uniref:ABC transporter substrate-binding protein n=1 Tax=Enterococcus casseliflavus TaxID=37734 RepID=A0ABD6Z277_ENTCA|nr:ABC transporter substrate-binding protein [Enterococcus casseliflavus]EOH79805.1 iron compound ABC transporter substrate-binding protein [Enterococcus casseliflavus ATCC 49996]EOU09188.1 iron compound ABC transporter substrate-binding protein [Enterococcus casseliflavus ATCC 49996]MBE9879584.1 ABC transporter substrate-binding protein [Enterococcus casseliflavus]MDT2973980.1 ABC transporter substrate-binding protein [Enterococcus casseliflavus]QGN30192.1 ABC transporter substrate-binding pr